MYHHFCQLDALREVVHAVRGRCEVYLDGGVRTGTDVLKALALGAQAVFIGRPAIYAVTYDVSSSKNANTRLMSWVQNWYEVGHAAMGILGYNSNN